MVAARSAQSAAKDVASLVAGLVSPDNALHHTGEILILVSRKNQAGNYENSLKEANILVSNLAESGKTLDSPAISELFYTIRSQLDPTDPIATRALLSLKNGIGSGRIKPLIAAAISGQGNFVDLVRASTDQRIQEVVSKLDSVPAIDSDMPGISAMLSIATHLGVSQVEQQALRALIEGIIGNEEMNLENLISALRDFQINPQINPDTLLNGPVRIMTMRQAKGLSAQVVICTDLDDDIVPGSDEPEIIQEQRRLLYVSMTRAIESLYLFYCGTRSRHNSRFAGTGAIRQPWEQRRISRFLESLEIETKTIKQIVSNL